MSQSFLQSRTHILRPAVQDPVCAPCRVVVFLVPPSLNADFRRAKTINIFGSSREALGYWKTTGRVRHQGKVDRFSPRGEEHKGHQGPAPPGATGRPNDRHCCVSGATPPSLRRSKPLAQPPTWHDKPINLAVARPPVFWAKTAQSPPRLLQNFAPRKSAIDSYRRVGLSITPVEVAEARLIGLYI